MEVEVNKKINFSVDDFLWRYLDIHKFLSFIIEKSLFFTRLDKFDDPLEGLTEDLIGSIASLEFKEKAIENPSNEILAQIEIDRKHIEKEIKLSQTTRFANCWFYGKKESIAMWDLYSNSDSIVIRYKPEELINIIKISAEAYIHCNFKKFMYGKVEYIDIWPFKPYPTDDVGIKYTAYKKDKSYEHEKEFRFIAGVPISAAGIYDKFELPLGDIEKDNFKIIANPKMEEWKFNNLKKILKNYSLSDKLEKSSIKIKK
jgi:hypothetical protein